MLIYSKYLFQIMTKATYQKAVTWRVLYETKAAINPGNLCPQWCWALIWQLNCFLQEIQVLLCTKVERLVQYIPFIWLLSTNRMTAADYFKLLRDGGQKHKFLTMSLLLIWLGGFGGLTTTSTVGGQINTTVLNPVLQVGGHWSSWPGHVIRYKEREK